MQKRSGYSKLTCSGCLINLQVFLMNYSRSSFLPYMYRISDNKKEDFTRTITFCILFRYILKSNFCPTVFNNFISTQLSTDFSCLPLLCNNCFPLTACRHCSKQPLGCKHTSNQFEIKQL